MPAPATADAFLDVVRKSNQVDCDRLDAYLNSRPRARMPEPRKLAASLIRAGVITLFQAEQFLLGKHKGFALGGYRIVERIGMGGSGTVYLAEHLVMRRWVAVKVLPTPLAADPGIRERFRREALAAGLLDHPNVVHVYDFRDEGGLLAIIMEYVQGPNLQQLINRRGGLPVPAACEYARQAALGLQHAHDKGLVHRDVKPANLLLDTSGLVKVLDLGLARFEVEGQSSLTQQFNNKMVMGTADFLPPEQAMSLHDVDHRADVYSLGATLFSLLAGQPPFHEGSIGQKLLWHQTRVPDRLDQVRPEVPAELADLVERMMAKRPEDRPASCTEVAAALARWAGPAEGRDDMRPSPGTLAEFSLASPSVALSCVHSGRLLPSSTPTAETISTKSRAKTAPLPVKLPVRPAEPVPAGPSYRTLLLVAGLCTMGAGLLGGLAAMLLMGWRG